MTGERLWDRFTANIDSALMFIVTMILTLGLFTLYSASYESPFATFVTLA